MEIETTPEQLEKQEGISLEQITAVYAKVCEKFPPQKRHVSDHDRLAWIEQHIDQMGDPEE